MRKGGGKGKGNEFERKICKAISEKWSNGAWKDLCWRATTSGGRATITKTKTKGYHGDICAVSPLIEPLFDKYCFELKHYKDLDIAQVLRTGKSQLLVFWRQALRAAVASDRIPLLIYKVNYLPEMLVFPARFLSRFKPLVNKQIPAIFVGQSLCICNFFEVLNALDITKFKESLGVTNA